MLPTLCQVLLGCLAVSARPNVREPECPKFYYEEKTLEKLVRLEHKVELQDQDLREWEITMENTLTKLDKKDRKMSETIEKAEKTVAEIQDNMTERAETWEQTFQEKLESHELSVQSFLENYKTPTVMFKARHVSRTDIVTGRVLVFTEPIANIGDGYDVTTGYFIAPVSGTYMFTSQICSDTTEWAHVRILVNDINVESTSHHGADSHGTCMTFTGVAVMVKGQRAWVQGSFSKNSALSEDAYRWNTFAGILINTI